MGSISDFLFLPVQEHMIKAPGPAAAECGAPPHAAGRIPLYFALVFVAGVKVFIAAIRAIIHAKSFRSWVPSGVVVKEGDSLGGGLSAYVTLMPKSGLLDNLYVAFAFQRNIAVFHCLSPH
jgi:hypothetical protein